MSNDEPPTISGAGPDTGDGRATGGKLISADVFMARLAGRQAERAPGPSESPALATLLGALESLGLDPTRVSPTIARMAGASQPDAASEPDVEAPMPGLDDLGMMQAVLDQFQARLRERAKADETPSDDEIDWSDRERQTALIHLAERLNPEELTGLDGMSPLSPEREAAMREGLTAGTQRALRAITRADAPRRRRRPGKRVAEHQAPYDASSAQDPSAPDAPDQ